MFTHCNSSYNILGQGYIALKLRLKQKFPMLAVCYRRNLIGILVKIVFCQDSLNAMLFNAIFLLYKCDFLSVVKNLWPFSKRGGVCVFLRFKVFLSRAKTKTAVKIYKLVSLLGLGQGPNNCSVKLSKIIWIKIDFSLNQVCKQCCPITFTRK